MREDPETHARSMSVPCAKDPHCDCASSCRVACPAGQRVSQTQTVMAPARGACASRSLMRLSVAARVACGACVNITVDMVRIVQTVA